MANFYADEQFPKATTIVLRALGHDVLTVQEAGNGNQKIPDPDVLAFATAQNRAVLTLNRYDFVRLHKQSPYHAGIIACSENNDFDRLVLGGGNEHTIPFSQSPRPPVPQSPSLFSIVVRFTPETTSSENS